MESNYYLNSAFDNLGWWEIYTKLYIQEIFNKDPKKRMINLYFRPHTFDTASFYKTCSHQILETITYIQLSLFEDYCSTVNHINSRPAQLFFKVDESIITGVIKTLIDTVNFLKEKRIDLVFDINLSWGELNNEIAKSFININDNGSSICLGSYDWRNEKNNKFKLSNEIIKYIRLAPPSNISDINKFIDTCFYIKETKKIDIIIERIQNKTDLDIACRTPYIALMGDYISQSYLARDMANIFNVVNYE